MCLGLVPIKWSFCIQKTLSGQSIINELDSGQATVAMALQYNEGNCDS